MCLRQNATVSQQARSHQHPYCLRDTHPDDRLDVPDADGHPHVVDDATRVEALLAEVRGRAISALSVEQVGREPFTPAEWQMLETGIRAGGTAMLDIVRERG
jgi:hypothetical protein